MLNFLKSFLVLLAIASVFFGIFFIIRSFFRHKHSSAVAMVFFTAGRIIALIILVALLLPAAVFAPYVIPWNRTVHLEKVAEIDVPVESDHEPDESDRSWICVYEHKIDMWFLKWFFGLFPGEDIDVPFSSEVDWPSDLESPELDFEHYSYLIVYASEAEKLTWNVWDTWDPLVFGVGRKWGTLTYEDDIDPHKVYIYRFPWEEIENHDFVRWVD